ncbi:hypothetical protein, partial [Agrobacterium pusense]|uniref:hypothetical protein n=1 Tax=Agrobacterium pusense TaxID=648995 RepID=UPI001AECF538
PEITDGYEIQLHHALGHDRIFLTIQSCTVFSSSFGTQINRYRVRPGTFFLKEKTRYFFRIIEREITERRKPYSTPDIALK